MKKIYVVLATIAVALAVSATAQAASYDPNLRTWVQTTLAKASETPDGIRTQPLAVYVRCYANAREFERGLGPGARQVIAYYRGGGTIHIRASTCRNARLFTNGTFTGETVGAFSTLLHEAIHRQGLRNERLTEAYATATMKTAGQLVEYSKEMMTAGQLVDYSEESDGFDPELWDGYADWGETVMRMAWNRSQRYVAYSYHSPWDQVLAISQTRSWDEAVLAA